MKKYFLFLILNFAFCSFAGELNIYTYSSLAGKGSLGALLQKEWESRGKKLKFTSFSTSAELLNQIFLEKEKTAADIVLGLDQLGYPRAEKSGFFLKVDYYDYVKNHVNDVPKFFYRQGFMPFDYGYLAFVYDSSKVKEKIPDNFFDFIKLNQNKKRVLLIDPRTSQLGLQFLVWTKMLWEEKDWANHMQELKSATKAWAPGWSAAYSLFLKGEGDFVLSYTTSPAYHIEEEKKDQYRAVLFKEGHSIQVEMAAILRSSKQQEEAKEFLKLLASKSIQEQIPKLQWMYPVLKGVKLPKGMQSLPKARVLPMASAVDESIQREWLSAWTKLTLSP